jgi:transcriptional activator protein UGA3
VPFRAGVLLELCLTRNPVLLPMAIEDKLLLDMLIAWSSSHLSLCSDEHRAEALEHRSTALKSFAASLSTINHSPALLLAGCLVFCSMSAIMGDTTGWHHHLLGAAQIIHNSGAAVRRDGVSVMSDSYEGRWLLRNFAYHDILMSITLDREPLIPGKYWIPELKTPIDSYFGLASEPMAVLSKISSLNGEMVRHIETYSSSPDSSDGRSIDPSKLQTDGFSSRAYSIETELREWKCAESSDPCLVSLAEAYRSAALIYLYRVIRRHIPNTRAQVEKRIANQVEAVVKHVVNMPLGCLPECTSLFPLFMAGGEATSKTDIAFIRERLQHIVTYRHFQNAASALSVLDELWLQHTAFSGFDGGDLLDWTDILKRRGWRLALS